MPAPRLIAARRLVVTVTATAGASVTVLRSVIDGMNMRRLPVQRRVMPVGDAAGAQSSLGREVCSEGGQQQGVSLRSQAKQGGGEGGWGRSAPDHFVASDIKKWIILVAVPWAGVTVRTSRLRRCTSMRMLG